LNAFHRPHDAVTNNFPTRYALGLGRTTVPVGLK
jgi:hypothetical protein